MKISSLRNNSWFAGLMYSGILAALLNFSSCSPSQHNGQGSESSTSDSLKQESEIRKMDSLNTEIDSGLQRLEQAGRELDQILNEL